jgi:NAD(P)-dependent dehydrogenase (short-subunit alcohol dehydrogenase family)
MSVAPFGLSLAGKTVLITGASKGIGRACAARFAEQGSNLFLVSRTLADLQSTQRELEAVHREISIKVLDADLSQRGSVASLMSRIDEVPSVLVNNAGAIPAGTVFDVDESKWREGWDLKVFGYINMCRAVYAAMREQQHRDRVGGAAASEGDSGGGNGVIINVIGAGANNPMSDYIAGSTGNIALDQFTRALGGRSLADGIRVVGIHPGPIRTERLGRMSAAAQEESRPGERPGRPEDVADLAAFLASPLARNITGTVITSDGGWSSRMM